jgi:integrase
MGLTRPTRRKAPQKASGSGTRISEGEATTTERRRCADASHPRPPDRARADRHGQSHGRPTTTTRHRGASVRTRNLRLTAIRSFFRFVSFEEPAHSALIQRVLAIPSKRHDKRQVHFLTRPEIEAILAAPDRTTRLGRRDHTLLLLAAQTGLRLSELIGLDRDAVHLGAGAHVRCVGKGRKERRPLTTHVRVALQAWLVNRRPTLTPAETVATR